MHWIEGNHNIYIYIYIYQNKVFPYSLPVFCFESILVTIDFLNLSIKYTIIITDSCINGAESPEQYWRNISFILKYKYYPPNLVPGSWSCLSIFSSGVAIICVLMPRHLVGYIWRNELKPFCLTETVEDRTILSCS